MNNMPVDEVIDSHIHLFNLKGTPRPMQPLGKLFGWNDRVLRFMAKKLMPNDTVAFFGDGTDLLGDYMPVDYRADAAPSNVGRYVHVQAGWTDKSPLDPVGETAWLESLDDGPAAIVGHADLNLGDDVALVLAAHKSASSKMRGVRHMLSWHEAESIMNVTERAEMSRTPQFRAGFDQLAEHDLSFDAWCYSGQLAEVEELAAYNPDVPMVLCHAGTPVGIGGDFGGVGVSDQERARIGQEWSDSMSSLATQQHVVVKLSGFLMPVLGYGYERSRKRPGVNELVDKLSPLVEHCIDAFGPQRCMFASNFPVDRVSAGFETMADAMVEMTARYGESAQEAMFANTAASFYRLGA
jgi:L-fuconolactonase